MGRGVASVFPFFVRAAFRIASPRIPWPAAHKAITTRKPRQVIPAPRKRCSPQPISMQPVRPKNNVTAEMWEDYRLFKAAGLLAEWRNKWAAYLPEQS